MISVSINKIVPAFNLPVQQPKNGSRILLSFDYDDCITAINDVITKSAESNTTKAAINELVARYNSDFIQNRVININNLHLLDNRLKLQKFLKFSTKIEKLGTANQEIIEEFAKKLSCFIDAEFVIKPVPWYSRLYEKVFGESHYDHKISICYTRIEYSPMSKLLFSVIEKSYDTFNESNVVLFNIKDADHTKSSNVITKVSILHKVFSHTLGLKHSDDLDLEDIQHGYRSYIKHSVTPQRFSYCINKISSESKNKASSSSDLLKCFGLVNDLNPVDLKRLQNIWGSKSIDTLDYGNNDTFCHQQITLFTEKYHNFAEIDYN